jgi:pimeloyl-ACP methyl ester carboxylesterase
VDVPTLVIHGQQDRLIFPSGGVHTADVIPGADLLLVEHMGHDLPAPLVPFLTTTIAAHARRAT